MVSILADEALLATDDTPRGRIRRTESTERPELTGARLPSWSRRAPVLPVAILATCPRRSGRRCPRDPPGRCAPSSLSTTATGSADVAAGPPLRPAVTVSDADLHARRAAARRAATRPGPGARRLRHPGRRPAHDPGRHRARRRAVRHPAAAQPARGARAARPPGRGAGRARPRRGPTCSAGSAPTCARAAAAPPAPGHAGSGCSTSGWAGSLDPVRAVRPPRCAEPGDCCAPRRAPRGSPTSPARSAGATATSRARFRTRDRTDPQGRGPGYPLRPGPPAAARAAAARRSRRTVVTPTRPTSIREFVAFTGLAPTRWLAEEVGNLQAPPGRTEPDLAT